jgi:hypothetical protein
MLRPGVFRWLWYALGGVLGTDYSPWVLHDLTVRTWRLRHAARTLIRTLPALFALLLPGALEIRVYTIALLMVGAQYVAQSFADETRKSRLFKHGYLPEIVLRDKEKEE